MVINPQDIRAAIVNALPISTSNYGEVPHQRDVYIPPGHTKALRLECNLVIGTRGVGKSFWTAVLSDAYLRSTLVTEVNQLELTDVYIGFGIKSNIEAYPDKRTFLHLMASGHSPYDIWTSVVIRWLCSEINVQIPKTTWNDTVIWVKKNPDLIVKLMQQADSSFQSKGRFGLVVFDALDRTSDTWKVMETIVRDLLKVVLWLKSFHHIHAKIFLREDQASRTVSNFPDASKLLSTKAELTWELIDLHGLLWQKLFTAEGSHGKTLRDFYFAARKHKYGISRVLSLLESANEDLLERQHQYSTTYNELPLKCLFQVQRNSAIQRKLFEDLAGPRMGKGSKSGVPYIWSVSHLVDGRSHTSPRSFLAAIRQAAEHSIDKYSSHPYPLHYESIKSGVQKASEIRVDEMAEDYPWVPEVMKPLKGLTVPCEFSVILNQWSKRSTTDLFESNSSALPPQHADQGWEGVRKDLERIGIFVSMMDGRVNLPDLYRVGFGLGRRGGVKPMR